MKLFDIITPLNRYTFNDVYLVFEFQDFDLEKLINSNQAILYQLIYILKYLNLLYQIDGIYINLIILINNNLIKIYRS